MAGFTVDTKLFRELGELLVGRDSTALVELIKNAYDADATKVEIVGRDLNELSKGTISIADDGTGMDEADFEKGFLRIAGRTKETADRRSGWFKRRFTGEKGVGRLAAHKLGRKLSVVSRKWDGKARDDVTGFAASSGVKATIDWDRIEKLETLAEVARSNAVVVDHLPRPEVKGRSSGTRFTIHGLRRTWTPRALDSFFTEVVTLTPPSALMAPLPSKFIKDEKSVFDTVRVRDAQRDAGFQITFGGEFSLREPELASALESAAWIIEVEYESLTRVLRIAVLPTLVAFNDPKVAKPEPFHLKRKLRDAPSISFQARIFQRNYASWPKAFLGIRVYHEGFRVLPYGDPTDDWLDLDRDYRTRGEQELGRLRRYSSWNLPAGGGREGLVIQGNRQFFGAVFLTREGASGLKMLVNREGFLPGRELDFVVEMVRLGIDLQIRQNSAARTDFSRARKENQRRQKDAVDRSDVAEAPTSFVVASLQDEALKSLQIARVALSRGDVKVAEDTIVEAERRVSSARELSSESISEAAMYRVVASMGLEQAAFIHEVNALAVLCDGVVKGIEAVIASMTDQKLSRRLSLVAAQAREIRDRLRRNAVYLADMTGIEGRKRRSRQSLLDRFNKVADFFSAAAEKRGITFKTSLPEHLKTPPMFPAEVSALFSNLLGNAVKFAGKDGTIKTNASTDDGELVIRMENTGEAVDLKNAEKLFEPFKSTTSEVDETLGQGMGLGLTITRSLLDEYGGSIAFVPPSKGFSTAVEVRIATHGR
ncbi:signal transduction histidine kinase [Bradyrhizobium sp. USDA 4011]